jgi:WD40 repeat protein
MDVSPNNLKIVVALNNGTISLIDTRTGKILGVSILQHSDISQVIWLDNDRFASVHNVHQTLIWQTNPRLGMEHKIESASLLCRHSDEQFLALQSNKLRFYRKNQSHTEVKIRPEFINGITAIEVLRLNKNFLLGTSNGSIKLCC